MGDICYQETKSKDDKIQLWGGIICIIRVWGKWGLFQSMKETKKNREIKKMEIVWKLRKWGWWSNNGRGYIVFLFNDIKESNLRQSFYIIILLNEFHNTFVVILKKCWLWGSCNVQGFIRK